MEKLLDSINNLTMLNYLDTAETMGQCDFFSIILGGEI
jgi:hypothetical protein